MKRIPDSIRKNFHKWLPMLVFSWNKQWYINKLKYESCSKFEWKIYMQRLNKTSAVGCYFMTTNAVTTTKAVKGCERRVAIFYLFCKIEKMHSPLFVVNLEARGLLKATMSAIYPTISIYTYKTSVFTWKKV